MIEAIALMSAILAMYIGCIFIAYKTYQASGHTKYFGIMTIGAAAANIPLWLIFLLGTLDIAGLHVTFSLNYILDILFLSPSATMLLSYIAFFRMVRETFQRHRQ